MKKPLILIILLGITGGFLGYQSLTNRDLYEVVSVVDGDTIKVKKIGLLKNQEEILPVRYIGIDTPELGKDKDECYAAKAKEINKSLVLGKKVRLEFDQNNLDKFGRHLAYVHLPDEEIMVNEYLLRLGAGKYFLDTVNLKHQKKLINAVQQARDDKNGLWKDCAKDPEVGCFDYSLAFWKPASISQTIGY